MTTTSLFVNLGLLVALVFFMLHGARRGLILSMCGLLSVLLACLGALQAQEMFTDQAAAWIQPHITSYFSEKLGAEVTELTNEMGEAVGTATLTQADLASIDTNQLQQLAVQYGIPIPEDMQAVIENAAGAALTGGIAGAAESFARPLARSIAGIVIYLIAFAVILLLCRIVAALLNRVDALPVIHTLNHTGGAAFGLLEGGIQIVVIYWLLLWSALVDAAALTGPLSGFFGRLAGTFF